MQRPTACAVVVAITLAACSSDGSSGSGNEAVDEALNQLPRETREALESGSLSGPAAYVGEQAFAEDVVDVCEYLTTRPASYDEVTVWVDALTAARAEGFDRTASQEDQILYFSLIGAAIAHVCPEDAAHSDALLNEALRSQDIDLSDEDIEQLVVFQWSAFSNVLPPQWSALPNDDWSVSDVLETSVRTCALLDANPEDVEFVVEALADDILNRIPAADLEAAESVAITILLPVGTILSCPEHGPAIQEFYRELGI